MPPCLTLSIIRYGSRVKWSNPGKGVAPSPTPWCSSYQKGDFGSLSTTVANLPQMFIYSVKYVHRLQNKWCISNALCRNFVTFMLTNLFYCLRKFIHISKILIFGRYICMCIYIYIYIKSHSKKCHNIAMCIKYLSLKNKAISSSLCNWMKILFSPMQIKISHSP